MNKRSTVLIDGDVLVYRVAASLEIATEFPDDMWVLWADASEGRYVVDAMIKSILEKTKCTSYRICLTAPNNFRLSVDETYKGNRAETRKPMILKALREYTLEYHGAELRPRLEGDDLLGIFATGENLDDGLIYSIDKDLRTVPGYHWDHKAEKIIRISEEEAFSFFMSQVLSGDPTDGYSGCPGVGEGTAKKALEAGSGLVPYQHELKSGARKGEVETRYRSEPMEPWPIVLSYYEKAGLGYDEALVQARLARILQSTDYDHGRIILWEPPMSEPKEPQDG
jgi:5'-3' exonuclease